MRSEAYKRGHSDGQHARPFAVDNDNDPRFTEYRDGYEAGEEAQDAPEMDNSASLAAQMMGWC